jgi:hypothetical protein
VTLTEEACRQQVQRVLDSKLFHSSPALRRLLAYLAEKTLAGEADELKEYTVGLEALGKPETYDPRQDSSVRFQTSKLRQRLAEYYQVEGGNDPVVVDYPRGRFKLVFSPRGPGAVTEDSGVRKWRRLALGALAALVLVSGTSIYFGIAVLSTARAGMRVDEGWNEDLAQIWSPFLSGKRPVVVCIGTPLFVHYRTAFVRLPGLNDWKAIQDSALVAGLNKLFHPTEPRPYFNFTGTGDAAGAFELARLLAPRITHLSLTRTYALSWDEIAANDMIFLGPPKFNLKLNEISLEQDFRIERYGIRNLKPAPGEPDFFPDGSQLPDTAEGLAGETYALISRIPGLHGIGETFVLAGNWTPGTLAAVQYVTRPAYAHDLSRMLRLSSGGIPDHYEIVVKVSFRQGTPVKIRPVLHHIRQAQGKPAEH